MTPWEWATLSVFGVALTLIPGAMLLGIVAADQNAGRDLIDDSASAAALAVALTLSLSPIAWILATWLSFKLNATVVSIGFLFALVIDAALIARIVQRSRGASADRRNGWRKSLPMFGLLAILIVG